MHSPILFELASMLEEAEKDHDSEARSPAILVHGVATLEAGMRIADEIENHTAAMNRIAAALETIAEAISEK